MRTNKKTNYCSLFLLVARAYAAARKLAGWISSTATKKHGFYPCFCWLAVHANSKQIDCWHKGYSLHQSNLIAHTVSFLMLLASAPDMVRRAILYKTLIST